jgi:protein-tyrosine phosphatase
VIDWHCHLLPGVDDGPDSPEEALELARGLHAAGFRTVHCTPHYIRGFHAADNHRVLRALGEMQELLRQEGVPLTLLPGREYYLDEFFADALADPLPLGETRLLLVEIPPHAHEKFVLDSLFRAVTAGFTPLIAHPERCRLLDPVPGEKHSSGGLFGIFRRVRPTADDHRREAGDGRPGLLARLRDMGCSFQGNLGSFAGIYGEGVRIVATAHLKARLYSHFGSDAHESRGLGRWLQRGLQVVSAAAVEASAVKGPAD